MQETDTIRIPLHQSTINRTPSDLQGQHAPYSKLQESSKPRLPRLPSDAQRKPPRQKLLRVPQTWYTFQSVRRDVLLRRGFLNRPRMTD